MPESVLEWGIALILSLQGLGDWLIGPMNGLTFMGNQEFFLLILPALYWCGEVRLGVRVGLLLLLGLGLNFLLKAAFHDPRPYWLDPEVRLLTRPEASFGIPSGHSQNAAAIWGMLAVYLGKGWGWAGAGLLIFFIGLSRLYLGVHFPTDVLVGWALGFTSLIAVLYLEGPLLARLYKLSDAFQVSLILGVSLGLILAGGLMTGSASSGWQIPAVWAQNAALQAPEQPIDPFSLADIISSSGAFFGFASGVILLRRRLSFETGGPWARRAGRYLLGVVGVFLLWQGLGSIFELAAADGSLLEHSLRYIRYSLIGLWISALAPLLFIQLKLASPQPVKEPVYYA